MTDIVERINQAHALCEDLPFPITLEVWRGGIEVIGWHSGRRYSRRVTWLDISQSWTNPLVESVDLVSARMTAEYERAMMDE